MEMKVLFVLFFTLLVSIVEGHKFDIKEFGAKPDADIREALETAWKKACESPTGGKVFIPDWEGMWYLSQAWLVGPCRSYIHFEIQGKVQADDNADDLPEKLKDWITIRHVKDLTMWGGGTFTGRGQLAWDDIDCHKNPKCRRLPINLSFNHVKDAVINDLTSLDSKSIHVNCISSQNVTFGGINIKGPSDDIAPKTDGFHIARSSNIRVLNSSISTGDDCISIGEETNGLLIENVSCGISHGISIGSLGKCGTEKDVLNVIVRKCTFVNSQNGVRIKTWPSTPAELNIKDIVFEELTMVNVSNPVIIDQEYCPHQLCDKSKPSKIQISHISIRDIKGTSATPEAVILACSSGKPCEHVKIGNIDLKYTGREGPITTRCSNVKPNFQGHQNPPICAAAAAADETIKHTEF